ncbi:MAG: protein-L-isoaspartate(D-aspartate) O-methyltransferase [Alphaproteobacteria bacterium]|nr:protein-L-isoaspartate(D-aspartate) O-methyltransferase [Alphaproteobacteria bacterium]
MTVEARKIRLVMRLRKGGISDTRVLAAIERVPRELFVPDTFRDQAYEDLALPIGYGQTISRPMVVAAMSQALDVTDRMTVLEIGTGSGYQTAVLAKLCRRVYTIERHAPLQQGAEALLRRLRIHNVTALASDGTRGWPEQAPFDRILVAAAAAEIPQALANQLAIGGIMVLPVGKTGRAQTLARLRRTEEGFTRDDLFDVRFVPLVDDGTAARLA